MNEIERLSIDSDLLRTFLAIALCGNLTAASNKLGRTQSAISVQLRKLETGLGTSLFRRSPKGMTLTPAGEALLPRARTILAEIREASTLFAAPLTGSIRVGLPDDFDESILGKVLTSFSRAHPDVQVMVNSGCTVGYPAAISDGSLDLAISSGPDSLDGEVLSTEETVWAARQDAPPDKAQPVPLAILDRNCW